MFPIKDAFAFTNCILHPKNHSVNPLFAVFIEPSCKNFRHLIDKTEKVRYYIR